MALRRLIKSPVGVRTGTLTPQPSPSRKLRGTTRLSPKEVQFPPNSPLRITLSGRHSDSPAKAEIKDELEQIFWRCATMDTCTIGSPSKNLFEEKRERGLLRNSREREADCPLTNAVILHHYRDFLVKLEKKPAKLVTRRASKKQSEHFLPTIVIPPLEPLHSPTWRLYRTGRKKTGRQGSVSPLAA